MKAFKAICKQNYMNFAPESALILESDNRSLREDLLLLIDIC